MSVLTIPHSIFGFQPAKKEGKNVGRKGKRGEGMDGMDGDERGRGEWEKKMGGREGVEEDLPRHRPYGSLLSGRGDRLLPI